MFWKSHFWLLSRKLLATHISSNYPISCHCSPSIAPENIRKPLVFWCFQGYRKWSVAWNRLISGLRNRGLLWGLLFLVMSRYLFFMNWSDCSNFCFIWKGIFKEILSLLNIILQNANPKYSQQILEFLVEFCTGLLLFWNFDFWSFC